MRSAVTRRDATRRPAAQAASEFRPDIQALRAVAVIAVVLYHLWPERLPGGFVGVDVFFVISGFLITQHLYKELSRTGRISLTQFWARRIRRLLPAALLVLAVSLAMVVLLMPRLTWENNLQEIGASAAYVENWLLGYHAVDYLAADNSATVAQHYWSLSVEEQFYLVWPLLLLAAVAVGRLVGRPHRRAAVLVALGLVAALSLGASLSLTAASPPLAFFATHTRAWEFAVGGIIAICPALLAPRLVDALRPYLSWLGLGLIAYSCLFLPGAEPFPGWIAIVPVAGAALVLAGGTSSAAWSPRRFAGLAPVQWIGDCSYSIYLWHWPPIVAAPWILHADLTWMSKLGILGLTLVLAYLTKRFVEDPIRTSKRWRARRWPSYAFAGAAMAVLLAVTSVSYLQLQQRNEDLSGAALERIAAGAPCFGAAAIVDASCAEPFARPADLDTAFAAADIFDVATRCQQDRGVTTLVLCPFGEVDEPTTTIAVVGNSHALRLMPALDLYGSERGWRILLAAKTDCMGLTSTPVGDQRPDDPCLEWTGELHEHLLGMPDLDGVVFASHVGAAVYLTGADASPANLAAAEERMVDAWRAFDAAGIAVMVTEDVPGMRPQSGPERIARSIAAEDPCALERSDVLRPNLMTDVAQRHPELASYIPLEQYFCDAEACHSLIGGVVVYSDSHHITATYSRTIAQHLGADVQAALGG